LAAKLLTQAQTQRVVLLGAPGSGKTTLMSYFAVVLAQKQPEQLGLDASIDWLPILIKIRDLVKQPEINILKYLRYMVEEDLGVESLPPDFFEHWLKDGRALILLDGLDEVAEEAKRYKVVERIESFLGTYSRNHAIVTSRPAGYKPDFFRTDEFPHYEILPFDDEQIQQFLDHWYDSRCTTKAEAERRKQSLKKALADNSRIQLLARNPLLLTIIALIHRYQAVLPKERHKLYEKAVDTLLTSWDANKELSNHEILEYLELDDLRRLMERLAYWIHSQGGTGDNEGGTLIDREELINQLSQYIREMKKVERYCAKAEAERFLDHIIRDRAGLLSKQGRDRYAFVHKTFQEYLTTQEIRDRQEEGFEVVLEHIQAHLHDPHWQEVLLLLIAQQKRGNPARALEEILSQPTLYERWLHRNLLFAGTCLAENIPVTDEALVQDILSRLVALETSKSPLVSSSIRNTVFKVLCSLNETQYEVQALQLLKNSAESIDKVRLCEYQAELGEQEAAVEQLLLLLQDEDGGVRSSAARALGQLGNASQAVVDALIQLLKDNVPSAFFALRRLGNASQAVIDALLPLLKDEDASVRSSAAFVLGQLGNASEAVDDALLPLLKDEDASVRSNAVDTLGFLSSPSEAMIDALLPLLKDEDASVRSEVAEILGFLGNNASPSIVDALLPLLKDEDASVRSSAASALGFLSNSSLSVVDALLPLLKDEDASVRSRTASALGLLSNPSEAMIDALLPLLKDEDASVRSDAASTLIELGNTSESVIDVLLLLLKDKTFNVRSRAVCALGRIGNASEVVVDALLPLLKDEASNMHSWTSAALGELGKTLGFAAIPNYITTKLDQWIEQNQQFEHVDNGVDALWQIMSEEMR
jgi:HEAT repeat protein/energy-coupling factor transporter ATP-binding protein EcfA2